jgi:hypothetical protein
MINQCFSHKGCSGPDLVWKGVDSLWKADVWLIGSRLFVMTTRKQQFASRDGDVITGLIRRVELITSPDLDVNIAKRDQQTAQLSPNQRQTCHDILSGGQREGQPVHHITK